MMVVVVWSYLIVTEWLPDDPAWRDIDIRSRNNYSIFEMKPDYSSDVTDQYY